MGWHPRQAEYVPLVKANPTASYLLAGRNETGKTHISWALYRHAIGRGNRTAYFVLQSWIDAAQRYDLLADEVRQKVIPPLLASQLETNAERWTVFFDEIHAVRVSDYTSRELARMFTAIRDFGHQLIATTNMTWEQLGDHYSKIDPIYGRTIMTRLKMCELLEMF
jgi:chromosomal replication initiation ATPase DnaA